MERRAETRGIEQLGQARRVTVEIAAEHRPHPTHGGVPTRLVEQVRDERPQLSLVTQETFQGPRQPSVAVREVLAQHCVQGSAGTLAGCLRLAHQAFELASHDIHIERDAGILECREPDAQGTFQQRGPVLLRSLSDERREMCVGEHEALDGQPVVVDPDDRGCPFGSGKRYESDRFHAPIAGSRV